MIAPALEEISNELGEKVTVAKLNIDDNPDAPPNMASAASDDDPVQERPARRHQGRRRSQGRLAELARGANSRLDRSLTLHPPMHKCGGGDRRLGSGTQF
jgi:hypothetical protein